MSIAFFYVWTIFYGVSWNGTPWVVNSESFPGAIRQVAQMFAAMSNWSVSPRSLCSAMLTLVQAMEPCYCESNADHVLEREHYLCPEKKIRDRFANSCFVQMHGYGPFIFFCLMQTLSIPYVYFLLPETKVCPSMFATASKPLTPSPIRTFLWRRWTDCGRPSPYLAPTERSWPSFSGSVRTRTSTRRICTRTRTLRRLSGSKTPRRARTAQACKSAALESVKCLA